MLYVMRLVIIIIIFLLHLSPATMVIIAIVGIMVDRFGTVCKVGTTVETVATRRTCVASIDI